MKITATLSLIALLLSPQQPSRRIAHVRSGSASLHKSGSLTILELTSPNAPIQRIPLNYPSDYFLNRDIPYETKLIAESPHHFLIFTDTFPSNPGNIQGMCGASDTGERFLHVVALGSLPHETFSVLIDSCLSSIEPSPDTPEWDAFPHATSGGAVGKLIIKLTADDKPSSTTYYYVAADGSVGRPGVKEQ